MSEIAEHRYQEVYQANHLAGKLWLCVIYLLTVFLVYYMCAVLLLCVICVLIMVMNMAHTSVY